MDFCVHVRARTWWRPAAGRALSGAPRRPESTRSQPPGNSRPAGSCRLRSSSAQVPGCGRPPQNHRTRTGLCQLTQAKGKGGKRQTPGEWITEKQGLIWLFSVLKSWWRLTRTRRIESLWVTSATKHGKPLNFEHIASMNRLTLVGLKKY